MTTFVGAGYQLCIIKHTFYLYDVSISYLDLFQIFPCPYFIIDMNKGVKVFEKYLN